MGLNEDTTRWLKGLTVPKLKEELTNRGLAVGGLKADLAARLTAALESEAASIKEPATEGEIAAGQTKPAPAKQQEEKSEPVEESSEDKEEPEQAAPTPAQHAPASAAPISTPAPIATPAAVIAPSPRAPVPASVSVEEEEVDYGDPNEPAQPSIEAQDAQQHAPADSSKSEPQPAGTSSGLLEDSGTGKRHPRAPIPLYQPRDRKGNKADAEDPPAQLTGASPTADKAAKLASVKPVAVAASVGKSAPSPGAIRRAASPLPEAPPAKIATPVPGTETAAIMIENLVRPFTEGQLKALLQHTGKVVDMWMPSIKTHAVVLLESEEQGAATYSVLHGLQWPQGSPKKLIIKFISTEVAAQAILEGNHPNQARTLAAAQAKAAQAARAVAAAEQQVEAEAEPEAQGDEDLEAKPAPGQSEGPEADAAEAGGAEAGARGGAGEEAGAGAGVEKGAEPAGEQPAKPAAEKQPFDGPPVRPAVRVGLGAVAAAKAALAAASAETAIARLKRARGEMEGMQAAKRMHGAQGYEPMEVEAVRTLDDLFKKTETKPVLYWLPLTDRQVALKNARLEEEEAKRVAAERSVAAAQGGRQGGGFANGMDDRRQSGSRMPSPPRPGNYGAPAGQGYGSRGGDRDRRW